MLERYLSIAIPRTFQKPFTRSVHNATPVTEKLRSKKRRTKNQRENTNLYKIFRKKCDVKNLEFSSLSSNTFIIVLG